ncbi:MAG: TIGR02679 family protein [Nitriliruptor sp.]|uniref:TIGR02679 family protein n=1 Tax=Nitriliruptor sp. TaxID=2448056 RepID=UPI0034A08EF4
MPEASARRGSDDAVDLARLEALLGGEDLARLRGRVRRRLELGGDAAGSISLADPSDRERAAVDRLLGRRPSSGASVTVPLHEVGRLLAAAGVCAGWRQAIEALDGPIVDHVGRRRTTEEAWAAVLHDLDGLDGLDVEESWLRGWGEELRATGLLRRISDGPEHAADLLARARGVLAGLPVSGVRLARLAAETLGDSHGLDADRPEATLVLKALQQRYLPPDERGPLPTGADRRALWAAAGVLLDELAAPALVWNLAASGRGPVDRTLQAHADVGEPVRLTLGSLLRHPPTLTGLAGCTVHVCENPTVVAAAADTLGATGAPLVCTDGQPSAAVQTLLRQLAAVGAGLLHHGDFDRGGLRIASTVIERFGARPWRMDIAAYRSAPSGPPLAGHVTGVPWAPALADAMNVRGVAVHEEQVLDDLVDDLRR